MIDSNPYIVIDLQTFEKMVGLIEVGKLMAEQEFPHLAKDFEHTLTTAKEKAGVFTGTQNKPTTKKAY